MNGLAGCFVSTIGKSHEHFDLTASRPISRASSSRFCRSELRSSFLRTTGTRKTIIATLEIAHDSCSPSHGE